jgi:poly-gamma-glutamate capsule biosynthesis protein CapA/YwtB (metallophosphatase superfamily)
MQALFRRLGGVALALVMIPVFIGLLACMPVPIGDPERSRIDEDLNGVWLAVSSEGEAALYVFQAYDKRTWLGRI